MANMIKAGVAFHWGGVRYEADDDIDVSTWDDHAVRQLLSDAPVYVAAGASSLATVATTGEYADLNGKPTLATVATTGEYADLDGKPSLSAVAGSGAYADLTGKPSLSTVAGSGAYGDLTGKPSLGGIASHAVAEFIAQPGSEPSDGQPVLWDHANKSLKGGPSTLVLPWVAATVYAAGQLALDPAGTVIVRIAAGTSRASYDATEKALWTTSGKAAYVGLPTSPTDGQLMAWSASLSQWVATNPSGNGEIAYAENVTGTITTATSNTSVDVPGCSIVVPAQTRPVYLSASLQGNGVTAGATNYHCATITEVSNGVDTALSIWGSRTIFIANSLDTCVIAGVRVGPTARTRTFKLQVSSLGTSSVTSLNSATNRSWIAAEVR